MTAGYQLTAGQMRDVRETVRRMKLQHGGTTADKPSRQTQQPKVVILDAALAVATNSKTGATSALATVCAWSGAAFIESAPVKQITVWNHSESTAHDADTFGVAKWISGHWMFFGDCAAMTAR